MTYLSMSNVLCVCVCACESVCMSRLPSGLPSAQPSVPLRIVTLVYPSFTSFPDKSTGPCHLAMRSLGPHQKGGVGRGREGQGERTGGMGERVVTGCIVGGILLGPPTQRRVKAGTYHLAVSTLPPGPPWGDRAVPTLCLQMTLRHTRSGERTHTDTQTHTQVCKHKYSLTHTRAHTSSHIFLPYTRHDCCPHGRQKEKIFPIETFQPESSLLDDFTTM